MELEIIEKKGKKEVFNLDKKMRVAAYARVSSKHDDQLDSFESQVKYFHDKIVTNPNWEYVRIYSDEGISGTSTNHRDGFNEIADNYISKLKGKQKKLGVR